MSLVAVPDACIIISASLRDTIFYAASTQLFRMRLTDDILDEVDRNLLLRLVKKGRTVEEAQESVQRLLAAIKKAFDDAIIINHRELVDKMPINAKDRHVMAAAVASSAQVIITQNLKDFPKHLLEPYGIRAQSADDFLVDLFYDNPEGMTDVVVKQSWNLHNPSKTLPEMLDALQLHAPMFSNLIRKEMNLTIDYSWPTHVEVKSDAL